MFVVDAKDTKPMLRSQLMLFESWPFQSLLFLVLLLSPRHHVNDDHIVSL